MKKQKLTGVITSKEHQEQSNNYKLKIITTSKQNFFFYSQKKHQTEIKELKENQEYIFSLYSNWKYWFLEKWETRRELNREQPPLDKRKDEILESNLQLLEKQARIKTVERLENRLNDLREQIKKASDNQELVFLDYFGQFTKLLLIKQLKIRNKLEAELTETEKKERQILDNITVNWFYKT